MGEQLHFLKKNKKRRGKMRSNITRALIVICSLFLSLTSIVFAEEGVTDTEIHIGSWGPQTGPGAAYGAIPRGTDAYFKLVNAEGGVHGRKIIFHHFDDAYNPAKTLAGVKQLQEQVGIFAWCAGVGTPTGMAVMDYLMERKIPWVAPLTGSPIFAVPPKEYLFVAYAPLDREAEILVKYGVETLKKKRVAFVYLNDELGKSGLKGAEKQLAKFGMKLVESIPVQFNETDMRPHLMRLRRANADLVIQYYNYHLAIRLMVAAKVAQYEPTWMGGSPLTDFQSMWKLSKGAVKGLIGAISIEGPDSKSPQLARYKEAYDRFATKGEKWSNNFYSGMISPQIVVEGLKRAGRNLTREGFVRALEQIKDFRETITGPITYKPYDPNDVTCRQGQTSYYLIKCLDEGKWEKLTGWMKPED